MKLRDWGMDVDLQTGFNTIKTRRHGKIVSPEIPMS